MMTCTVRDVTIITYCACLQELHQHAHGAASSAPRATLPSLFMPCEVSVAAPTHRSPTRVRTPHSSQEQYARESAGEGFRGARLRSEERSGTDDSRRRS